MAVMSPHWLRSWSLVVVASSWSLVLSATPGHAQQDELGGANRPSESYEAKRILQTLLTPVDVRAFPRAMTFKEALCTLYEQVSNTGRELPILVDKDSFSFHGEELRARDIYDRPVVRPTQGRGTLTAVELLEAFLAQLPPGAGWLVRRDYIEITTTANISPVITFSEALGELLHAPVNLSDFRRPMPLRALLSKLNRQLSMRKGAVPFHVDAWAFHSPPRRPLDMLATTVHIPRAPTTMTVAQFLHYALQPLRGYEPTVVMYADAFEITTVSEAQRWRDLLGKLGKPVTMTTRYGGGIFGRPQ
jgi:hypothetical protein